MCVCVCVFVKGDRHWFSMSFNSNLTRFQSSWRMGLKSHLRIDRGQFSFKLTWVIRRIQFFATLGLRTSLSSCLSGQGFPRWLEASHKYFPSGIPCSDSASERHIPRWMPQFYVIQSFNNIYIIAYILLLL